MLERRAERAELRLEVPDPDPHDRAPTGEGVQAGQLLREHQRVALGQDDDAGAQTRARRHGGAVRQRDDRIEDALGRRHRRRRRLRIRQDDVLAAPQRLESGRLGCARDPRDDVRIAARIRVDREETEAKGHRVLLTVQVRA